MCYGEQPPVELLLDSINGSLVVCYVKFNIKCISRTKSLTIGPKAVIVIEDEAAIPGWDDQDKTGVDSGNNEYQVSIGSLLLPIVSSLYKLQSTFHFFTTNLRSILSSFEHLLLIYLISTP